MNAPPYVICTIQAFEKLPASIKRRRNTDYDKKFFVPHKAWIEFHFELIMRGLIRHSFMLGFDICSIIIWNHSGIVPSIAI